MSFMTGLLADFSALFRPHLTFIATALIITVLVIFSGRINKALYTLVHGAHFIIRTLVFVALCVILYGLVPAFLVPYVKQALLFSGQLWLGVVIVLVFLLVGWLAERQSRRG